MSVISAMNKAVIVESLTRGRQPPGNVLCSLEQDPRKDYSEFKLYRQRVYSWPLYNGHREDRGEVFD